MLQHDVKEKPSAIDNRECKWENRIFSKSGKVYFTGRTFESQEAAEIAVIKSQKMGDEALKMNELVIWDYPNGLLKHTDYAWHLQIPVLV
jgi:hypothetical protein